jgi:hypothetical protein
MIHSVRNPSACLSTSAPCYDMSEEIAFQQAVSRVAFRAIACTVISTLIVPELFPVIAAATTTYFCVHVALLSLWREPRTSFIATSSAPPLVVEKQIPVLIEEPPAIFIPPAVCVDPIVPSWGYAHPPRVVPPLVQPSRSWGWTGNCHPPRVEPPICRNNPPAFRADRVGERNSWNPPCAPPSYFRGGRDAVGGRR